MIGQAISHYRILDRLGAGGMGEVYLAEDTILKRRVALKILPPEYTRKEERLRRFKQEAKAASALNHPNILTIHEVGEDGSHQFIVTEFIEGETLRALLKRRGAMKTNDALNVAVQVASALAAAHQAGIVHRDIKPANIMIRGDGYVKVLDFGLAKLIESESQDTGDTSAATKSHEAHTQTGVVVGTAPYMSPEQARGLPVDTRTDIWSLGCLLYEMLSRCTPFAGQTVTDVLVAILEKEPPSLKNLSPFPLPDELDWIILKTLRKRKEDRYQSAKELLNDLQHLKERLEFEDRLQRSAAKLPKSKLAKTIQRSILVSILLIGIAGSLLYIGSSKQNTSELQSQIKSLAVLPLQNLSGDPSQEYFVDGMTEELIGKIAQIGSLRVISRTSVMRYKKISNKSIPEIAGELKVDSVIEGSVQRSSGRVKVTVKLIQVSTDSPLLVRDYERDGGDVLQLQSDVAREIADEIRIHVTPEERRRLEASQNIHPQAHETYLLGRYHLRTNEEDLQKAIAYFERAIQLAPDYSAAYGSLAEAWNLRGIWGIKNFKETKPVARQAALKALALDPRQLQARLALGWVYMFDWNWSGAEQEFTRALDIDRNSADAHRAYGDLLSSLERHAEAIREMKRAEELDPLSSTTQSRYARALYRAHKYEEALPHVRRAIELDPNPGNTMPYWILGELYSQIGRYDEAITNLRKANLHGGDTVGMSGDIATAYARMGNQKEARRILQELKASTDPTKFSDLTVAYA
ncbi:protein kinase, partial [bacterium]|nr:protein kinase [bacterium]